MTVTARPRLLALATAAALVAGPGLALAQGTGTTPGTTPGTATSPPASRQEQTLQNNSATRALDRAAGTNTSGAYPGQSDGTPGNPPGTAATRALDRAAGTNTSGAYPGQSDGTPGNPPGTAAERELDRATEPDRAAPRPDRRSEAAPRLLLAQNPLGPRPGLESGATLSGPEAKSGTGNNTGNAPGGSTTPTPGNAASQPERQGGMAPSGGPSQFTTGAPSLETREVRPPTGNPTPQQRPESAN
ncbi:hypothetical protein [Teichococcus rhizosphaerae]|uniref:hypothetical protein n=1 Tax=Teichococcus rhizosphaerae TaxID=1335062 RepID=UPI00159BD332|nr:hypothetical protein [Pseudoroseomonas rhizosphaerae]